MDELTVQTHDFNNAKKQLKEFSEKIPSNVDVQTVDTNGGLFNLFEHNVTGNELNNLTTQIQNHLIAINNLHIESIKEFGQVYKALEALDKDYIQAIILSIKAAEKASNQAKESAFKAEKNSLDIAKTIKVQTQTINVLKQFKEQIDKYEQLKNIDEIWSDCQTIKKDIRSINIRIENQKEEIDSETKIQMNYICNLIDENKMNYENRNKILLKKFKIAYILAGSSVGVTLINFVLHILGVI